MSWKSITAPGAAAVGPYSHGAASSGLVFLSGQTPLDSATGKLAAGDIEQQVKQCFHNLSSVLSAAGLTLEDVVKCTVFLADMDDFEAMNRIYAEHFPHRHPARTTIGVAALPLNARVEIEMIAEAREG